MTTRVQRDADHEVSESISTELTASRMTESTQGPRGVIAHLNSTCEVSDVATRCATCWVGTEAGSIRVRVVEGQRARRT